jgi:hypothetical protein
MDNGLGINRFTHDGTYMGWKPHMLGRVPQGLFSHKMEDVVVAVTHTSFIDEKHPSSPWTQCLEAFDVTLLTLMSPSRV